MAENRRRGCWRFSDDGANSRAQDLANGWPVVMSGVAGSGPGLRAGPGYAARGRRRCPVDHARLWVLGGARPRRPGRTARRRSFGIRHGHLEQGPEDTGAVPVERRWIGSVAGGVAARCAADRGLRQQPGPPGRQRPALLRPAGPTSYFFNSGGPRTIGTDPLLKRELEKDRAIGPASPCLAAGWSPSPGQRRAIAPKRTVPDDAVVGPRRDGDDRRGRTRSPWAAKTTLRHVGEGADRALSRVHRGTDGPEQERVDRSDGSAVPWACSRCDRHFGTGGAPAPGRPPF